MATTAAIKPVKKRVVVNRISAGEYEAFVKMLDLLKLGWNKDVETIDFARELVSLSVEQAPDMKMCFDKYNYLLKHHPKKITDTLHTIFGTTVYPLRILGLAYIPFEQYQDQFLEALNCCKSIAVRNIIADVIQSHYVYVNNRSSLDLLDNVAKEPHTLEEPYINTSTLTTLGEFSQLCMAANKLIIIGRALSDEMFELADNNGVKQKLMQLTDDVSMNSTA